MLRLHYSIDIAPLSGVLLVNPLMKRGIPVLSAYRSDETCLYIKNPMRGHRSGYHSWFPKLLLV